MELRHLLNPASIAIVGDSPSGGRGAWIHSQLLEHGYRGKIFPVNPRYDEVRGLPCYGSVLDIPDEVEFIALAIGAGRTPEVLEQAASKGVKAGLLIASGFAESGDEGKQIQAEVTQIARDAGMALCGPNCYGIANLHGNFVAYGGPLADGVKPGPVAMVFQSGALTHSVIDPAVLRGIGFSWIVTTGNEAVAGLADYVSAISEDENTRVIACFVEGFRDLPGFAEAVSRARQNGKRVVLLKVGRSENAKKAAMAHTGAVTGNQAAIDALCAELGVIQVSDLDEMIESLHLASLTPRLGKANVGLVSISGGGSGMMADLAEQVGLPVSPFTEVTRMRLAECLPSFAHPNNPLDATGAVGERPELMQEVLEGLIQDQELGFLSLAINSPTPTEDVSRDLYRAMVQSLASLGPEGPARAAISMTSGPLDDELREIATAKGIPYLVGIREALKAIASLQLADAREERWVPDRIAGPKPEALAGLGSSRAGAWSESESKALLRAVGIDTGSERIASSASEAAAHASELGFPVVLKVESADIPHKSDVGGVKLGLRSEAEVVDAFGAIMASIGKHAPQAEIAGISVQSQAETGVDVLVGVDNRSEVGPLIVFGLGGIFVELLEDVAVRLAPVDRDTALEMIGEVKAGAILKGYRGANPSDVDALADAIVAVSRLAWWLRDEVSEIDINPLRVFEKGQGVRALDALVVGPAQSNQ